MHLILRLNKRWNLSPMRRQSVFGWCLCLFGSGCTFGIRVPFKCYISLSTNIFIIYFLGCSKNVSVAFHFTVLQIRKAVGQREEENMIYLFLSLNIPCWRWETFYLCFFSAYFVLGLGLVPFIPFITQCSNAPAHPGPINTYAVWWCAKRKVFGCTSVLVSDQVSYHMHYAVKCVHNL